MTSEFPKNFEALEHPLTQEEEKQLLVYFQKHPDEARAVLSRVASTTATQANQIEKPEQTTGEKQNESSETESLAIPVELGDLEKFGDFLKERLAKKDGSAVVLVREMKKFVDMTNTLKIDGAYTGTLDGKNKSESELNAQALSKVISDISQKFYKLLYEEPEETFKNQYDTYLGADLTMKRNCQQYLDGKGIQGITIILAFNKDRFDARTMVLHEYTDNRMFVKKAHSWAVTYAGRIMQHAVVETY